MTDMMAKAERGDIEPTLRDADDSDAELRAALEKDRQRAQQLRRNARATYRAMEGWQGVGSEEDWLKVCADSQEQYESGRFFLERLGAERHLDPKLMATLGSLRQTPDFALPVECSPFGLLTRGRKMRERPHGRASAEGRRQAGIQHGLQASNGAAGGDGREDGGRAQSRARHAPSVIRSWKRLAEAGATTAVQAHENVVPANHLREAYAKIRELERALRRKTMEVEILRAAQEVVKEMGMSRRPTQPRGRNYTASPLPRLRPRRKSLHSLRLSVSPRLSACR